MQYRKPPEGPRPTNPAEITVDAAASDGTGPAGRGGADPWWRPGTPTELPSDGPIDCWTDDPDDEVDLEVLPRAGR